MCTSPFVSQVPFASRRIQAAAIYCSDGRFGEHMDDFLHNALELPRYDRLIVPGGPARLVDRFVAFDEQRAAGNDLKFLVDAHQLERIVLIAHSDCAYYTSRKEMTPERLEAAQRADLLDAARVINQHTGVAHIDTFFARAVGESVQFEVVGEEGT